MLNSNSVAYVSRIIRWCFVACVLLLAITPILFFTDRFSSVRYFEDHTQTHHYDWNQSQTVRRAPNRSVSIEVQKEKKMENSGRGPRKTALPNVTYVHGVLPYIIIRDYKGPLVKGWPPTRNRSMPLYVKPNENTFFIFPRIDLNTTVILLLIHSRGAYRDRRTGIRKTWMADMKSFPGFAAAFVIGRQSSEEEQESLFKESKKYRDILQVDVDDDYWHLTIKETMAYKYAMGRKWETTPKFLLRLDDDSYLNIPRLHRIFIKNTPRKIREGHVPYEKYLGGFLYENVLLRPDPKNMGFVESSECPYYMFSGKMYPPWLSGSAYIVSFPAAKCIYQKALELPFLHINDVFLTGFAAQVCGIPRLDLPHFNGVGKEIEMLNTRDLTVHWIEAPDMYKYDAKMINLRRDEDPDVEEDSTTTTMIVLKEESNDETTTEKMLAEESNVPPTEKRSTRK